VPIIDERDGGAAAAIAGELNLIIVGGLMRPAIGLLARRRDALILDLSEVRFCDSLVSRR
jgi:hypothetical protein